MTSSRVQGGHEFCCDTCGTVRDPGKLGRGSSRRDFTEEWQDAKEEGWRAVLKGKGWTHMCPECSGE